ncbi:MAG: DoxX family protein [Sphingobacteriales bacterium]|nr:DoxX family protein [Sphingobacteriales bacterium]
MNSKTKNIIIWILTGLVSFIFIGSGIFKLMGGNAEMANGVGGISNLISLGILELIITALFLFPRTGVVGALLMIAYMGGAMAVLFVSHQPFVFIIVIQALIWITSALRFPELKSRLID